MEKKIFKAKHYSQDQILKPDQKCVKGQNKARPTLRPSQANGARL